MAVSNSPFYMFANFRAMAVWGLVSVVAPYLCCWEWQSWPWPFAHMGGGGRYASQLIVDSCSTSQLLFHARKWGIELRGKFGFQCRPTSINIFASCCSVILTQISRKCDRLCREFPRQLVNTGSVAATKRLGGFADPSQAFPPFKGHGLRRAEFFLSF